MKTKIICATLYLIPFLSFAWGSDGHKMVATIAQKKLNPGVEAQVQKFLGTMTFQDAATWMDDIKSDHAYDYMKPWHYVNIEKGGTYVKSEKDDIVSELDRVIAELQKYKTMKESDVMLDLKILFHLCGDMTQPLHSGYGTDRGGNTVTVTYKQKETNLHSVWDSGIIFNEKISADNCLAMISKWTPEQTKAIEKIDVMAWMLDSRSLLDEVYSFKNNTITAEYATKNKPLIEQQIAKGGMRLAAVLNEVFSKE
ncbi:MAG: S1/P1 nuclease [Bacteroidia bacterium]